jgi:hypothetical protein
MSRNAAIIDDNKNESLYKLLQQSSLSKSANIPMIVVKTFIPNNDNNIDEPQQQHHQQSIFGLKLFSKTKQFKQIEIHRGMTVNVLFSRDNWLFIKTAQNESGYVPLDSCKPVVRRSSNQQNMNRTEIIDATCVSLLDISRQDNKIDTRNNNNDEYEMLINEEDENLSELEFSQYDNKNISEYIKIKQQQQIQTDNNDENQQRLFKIKHYFKSLEIETNLLDNISSSSSTSLNQQQRGSIAVDSGYSDSDSNIASSKHISQSYELLSQCSKPTTRRGIKTNGSICSVSPNPTFETISKTASLNSLSTEEAVEELIQKQVEINSNDQFKTRPNLSTIIEQSYNTTMEFQRAVSNSVLGNNNSLVQINNKCDLSNLQGINSTKTTSCIDLTTQESTSSCYKQICDNYEPLFNEDLAVYTGEYVTVLEDHNPEWCYVISKNGKGYIPRSCIQF